MVKSIHIVDDDSGFRSGIERLLLACGLPVRTYSSAEEYRAQADPDGICLILDIYLGRGMSGIDLMRELKRSGSEIPIVLVTANDDERTRRAAFSAGCSSFLQKPVAASILLGALSNAAGAELPIAQ